MMAIEALLRPRILSMWHRDRNDRHKTNDNSAR
jgi:hypothetical protein